jgi:hypothetical protein
LPGAIVLVAITALAAAAQPAAAAELTDATIVEREGAVEVWVRLSGKARFQSELMDGPYRLVLDFEDTVYRWVRYPVPVVADPVRQLRGSQFRAGLARFVIELSRKAAYAIETDREGLRIVIPRTAATIPPAAVAPPPPPTAAGPPVKPPPPAGGPSVKPAPGPRSLATPLVYGIIRLDERQHAYIFDPATRQVRRYAEGDALGDAVVETIGDRHVVLRTPSGRMELRVDEARRDTAPRTPESPAPGRVKPPPPPVGPIPTAPRS